jgi:hypothetical protein
VGEDLLAGAVEPVHLGAAGGQHHHPLAGIPLGLLERLPPVLQQRQGGGRLALGRDDPVVGLVGGHRLIYEPGPNEFEGLALPSVLLAAVFHQLARPQPQPQGAEAAASVHRGQLPVIAD